MDRDMASPPCGFGVGTDSSDRRAGHAGAGAGRSRLLRLGNARPVQVTARGAPPPVRAYPVTRPELLMAQAALPRLLSVLRPVVPTRNYRSHPPHPAL